MREVCFGHSKTYLKLLGSFGLVWLGKSFGPLLVVPKGRSCTNPSIKREWFFLHPIFYSSHFASVYTYHSIDLDELYRLVCSFCFSVEKKLTISDLTVFGWPYHISATSGNKFIPFFRGCG